MAVSSSSMFSAGEFSHPVEKRLLEVEDMHWLMQSMYRFYCTSLDQEPDRSFYRVRRPITVEPPIVDPPRKGHCMVDLSIKDTARRPKKITFPIVSIQCIENLREEDNVSIKDKTAEFILLPKCPLFGGSTVKINASVLLTNDFLHCRKTKTQHNMPNITVGEIPWHFGVCPRCTHHLSDSPVPLGKFVAFHHAGSASSSAQVLWTTVKSTEMSEEVWTTIESWR